MDTTLKVFSLNCNGLNSKLNDILNNFYQNSIDILFLQETFKITEKTKNILKISHPNLDLIVEHSGTPTQNGIGYLARKDLKIERINTPSNYESNFLKFNVTKDNYSIHVVNLYAPAVQGREHAEFFKNVNKYLKAQDDIPLFVLGDFNFVEEPRHDRTRFSDNYLAVTEISRKVFSEIKSARNLVDIYRHLNPNGTTFTHFNHGAGIHSRLDRIYVNNNYKHIVSNFFTSATLISDHSLVGITIEPKPNPKWGHGHPKMNPYYLKENILKSWIDDIICSWKYDKHNYEPILHLPVLKEKIWEKYLLFVKMYHHNQSVYLESLYNGTQDRETLDKIFEIQNFSNNLKRASGLAYFKEVAEEDFLPLYCKNKIKCNDTKNIKSIMNENEIELTDKEDIITAIRNFYQNLYTSSNPTPDIISEFLDMDLPKVNEDLLESMKRPISSNEVKAAIKSTALGKTPGPDGIPIELYLDFIDEFSEILSEYYNNIFLHGSADDSFLKSIISLLYKNKGILKLLKNWRPISLLNSDYKILTKIIATRMTPALAGLIHENQTCGVPGRSSFENLYNLSAIVDQVLENDDRLLLVTLDQEKAFDRIEHSYIREVLSKFGFPDEIIKWYDIISENAEAQICINGYLSDPIKIQRSVRQGCPLSMIIYVLGIEPVATQIRKDRQIKGYIPINSRETKISQYADDSTPILTSVRSYFRINTIFINFGRASGSKLNTEKTKIAVFGKWDPGELKPIENLIKPSVEILGVNFGKDLKNLNWPAKFAQCNGIIKSWEGAQLSLRSRIYIIHTFILSNIWHVARAVQPNDSDVEDLQRGITRFLWNGANEILPRKTTFLPILKGGIGMPDIKSKLASMQLQKLCYAKDKLPDRPPWVGYLIYIEGFPLRVVDPGFAANCFRRRLPTSTEHSPNLSPRLGPLLERLTAARGYDPSIWEKKLARPFYEILIASHTPNIMIKYRSLNWPEIWRLVWKHDVFDRSDREFLWLQFHEALPFAKKGGVGVPTLDTNENTCRFCHKYIETHHHIFASCPYLKRFREQIFDLICNQPALPEILRNQTQLDILVLHNIPKIPLKLSKIIFSYSTAYKLTIWRLRGSTYFGAPIPTLQKLGERFNTIIERFNR